MLFPRSLLAERDETVRRATAAAFVTVLVLSLVLAMGSSDLDRGPVFTPGAEAPLSSTPVIEPPTHAALTPNRLERVDASLTDVVQQVVTAFGDLVARVSS